MACDKCDNGRFPMFTSVIACPYCTEPEPDAMRRITAEEVIGAFGTKTVKPPKFLIGAKKSTWPRLKCSCGVGMQPDPMAHQLAGVDLSRAICPNCGYTGYVGIWALGPMPHHSTWLVIGDAIRDEDHPGASYAMSAMQIRSPAVDARKIRFLGLVLPIVLFRRRSVASQFPLYV